MVVAFRRRWEAVRQPRGLPLLPPARAHLKTCRKAVSLQHIKPQIPTVMRPPVVRVVLAVSGVQVSGLETKGALAKVVYLEDGLELSLGGLLEYLPVAVASVVVSAQITPPEEAIPVRVQDIVDRRGNR